MVELKTSTAGFRFPYQDWTETSTPQNLQFLEAMLGEYLHNHEGSTEQLYINSAGLRMPFGKSMNNLEQNMEYVEAQLEKNLHKHEAELGGGGELMQDGGVETYSVGLLPLLTGSNPFVEVAQSSLGDAVISTASPRNGSKHVNSGSSSPEGIMWGTEDIGGGFQGSPVTSAADWEASVWVKADTAATCTLQVEIYKVVDGSITAGGIDSIEPFNVTTSYTQLLVNGTMPADRTHVHMRWDATGTPGPIFDFDDFSFKVDEEPAILHTTYEGFRFPYGWTTPGAIRNNARFLQEQLSQYLHKHEEVA